MQTVYKYPLTGLDVEHEIEVPIGAEIISAIVQNDVIVVYAQIWFAGVAPHYYEKRLILTLPTGMLYSNFKCVNLRPINTVVLHNGEWVQHVFEVEPCS